MATAECGFPIRGPRIGGKVVAWLNPCRRRVIQTSGEPHKRCWQHRKGAVR